MFSAEGSVRAPAGPYAAAPACRTNASRAASAARTGRLPPREIRPPAPFRLTHRCSAIPRAQSRQQPPARRRVHADGAAKMRGRPENALRAAAFARFHASGRRADSAFTRGGLSSHADASLAPPPACRRRDAAHGARTQQSPQNAAAARPSAALHASPRQTHAAAMPPPPGTQASLQSPPLPARHVRCKGRQQLSKAGRRRPAFLCR